MALDPPPAQFDPTPPAQLRLPSLRLSASVVPVDVGPDGRLGVPDDPKVLGWWRSGAAPGSGRGSVVIDGHVDSAALGPGSFFLLGELGPGDPVIIETGTGDVHQYRVTGRRQFPKSELPANDVFSQATQERLVLITCGGRFDRSRRRYEDNIVIFAVPRRTTAERSPSDAARADSSASRWGS